MPAMFPRLVVRVDGDEVSLDEHPMNLDVERAGRAEEVLNRLQAVPGLRVVLNVALDDQLVEGSGVAGTKCIEEPADDLPVGGRYRGREREAGERRTAADRGRHESLAPPDVRGLALRARASPAYVMAQMGHTSSALALEVYAKKMERSRNTGRPHGRATARR
jgi:hypothetical protein